MQNTIEAILFDMGGTLRGTTRRPLAEVLPFILKIERLLGIDADPKEFKRTLSKRARAYKRWSERTLVELSEEELWTRWMLPDFPAAQIRPISIQLNQLWRETQGKRSIFPETQKTILDLFRRGYRLGLVSNTTSSIETPRAFEELGISGCFDTVILSCVVGRRKPGPEMLLEAVCRMQVRPDRCAYIGDRPDRDVAAARRAGFARTVILLSPNSRFKKLVTLETKPDHIINNLTELLNIFPSRGGKVKPVGPRYDLSLSTMWGIKQFSDLNDFLRAAPRFGIARIELNHQISQDVMKGLALNGYQVSSVHEPCPTETPAEEMRKRDLLISSPDEVRRRQGVDSIKRSIDLAHAMGAHTVVVHPGQIQVDGALEAEMRTLYNNGQVKSAKFEELRLRVVELRAELVGPYLKAVSKSLRELLDYAARFKVRLGIENRYHIFDIPWPDEMSELLTLADSDRLGFLYDVGHAQSLDRLGFYPHEEWLKRFANRIIGAHLHDVIGVADHKAPGLGEIDFRMVASYLPKDAYRVLEIHNTNTPEQVMAGLKVLADSGCVNIIH